MASQTKRNSANHTVAKSCLNMPWLSSRLLALQHSMKLECGMKSITIYESLINQLQKQGGCQDGNAEPQVGGGGSASQLKNKV